MGILASCETTDPLIEEAQKNIFTQNYDSALAVLDRSIEANPNNGVPHYYKAMTFAEQARTIEPVSDRKETYKNFRESILTARETFETMEETPAEAESVTPLVMQTWGFEHNAAIEYVNDDSVSQSVDNPLEISVAHLENAVIVNPDSVLSWDILAQVAGLAENFEKAEEAQKQAMSLKNPPEAQDFLRLGIYQRNLDNVEGALETLEDGVDMYPDSVTLVQSLADVYMAAGQRDKSVATIQELIEQEPENAQYRLALGTQLLQATTEISEEITANYDMVYDLDRERRDNPEDAEEISADIDSLLALNQDMTENMDGLSERAQEELSKVIELRPEDPKAYEYLAISYQNKAAALYEERNFTQDNDLANELNEQAKSELQNAVENYEKAVELDPDNSQYWQSLSRIYVQLDMQEKAEEAMEKAGM